MLHTIQVGLVACFYHNNVFLYFNTTYNNLVNNTQLFFSDMGS